MIDYDSRLARLYFCIWNTSKNEIKMWSSQWWLRFKQSQSKPRKCVRGFNGIRTHGLCISAAVLHRRVYEDSILGSRPIYWIYRARERNETYKYYVNCGHTNEMTMWSSQLWLRLKQSQSKPEKSFQPDSNPWPLPWVFIAQLAEHCSANAKAMESNHFVRDLRSGMWGG